MFPRLQAGSILRSSLMEWKADMCPIAIRYKTVYICLYIRVVFVAPVDGIKVRILLLIVYRQLIIMVQPNFAVRTDFSHI